MPRYYIISGRHQWPSCVSEELGLGQRVRWTLVLAGILGLTLLAAAGRAETPVSWTVGQGDGWSGAGHTAALVTLEGPLSLREWRLLGDGADGRWDEHSLLEAALVASGVDREDVLVHYQRQAAELLAELVRSGPSEDPRRRAQEVFEFLHRRVLRGGYRLNATDLTVTFDHGHYNCVSASVLFKHFAAGLGLRVSGLETASHATSRVFLGQGVFLDIETTYANWFRLVDSAGRPRDLGPVVRDGLARSVAASSGSVGGLMAAGQLEAKPTSESKSSDGPHEVSDVELVATIYYNRGVDRLDRKEYAEALTANAKALRLDPRRATARGNLLASLNNWAIALSAAGRHDEAVSRLRQGLVFEPDYPPFVANFVHVHRQWVRELCQEGRFPEAIDVLQAAATVRPCESYFASARHEVSRRWTLATVEGAAVQSVAPGHPGQANP